MIWKVTPKILPIGSKVVDIAELVAACTFNEGTLALLLIMHGMDLKLGRNSHQYARKADENRVCAAQKKSASEIREARIRHRYIRATGCPGHCSCSRFFTLWPWNRRF